MLFLNARHESESQQADRGLTSLVCFICYPGVINFLREVKEAITAARALLLVLCSFFGILESVKAEDYGWKIEFVAGNSVVFTTPQEACDAKLKFLMENRADLWQLKGPASYSFSLPIRVHCAAIYGVHYPNGGFGYGQANRVGDSCKSGSSFKPLLGVCESPIVSLQRKQQGAVDNQPGCTPSPLKGNPVNISTGNKYQQVVDYKPAAAIRGGLVFSRIYNSSNGLWVNNYSAHLAIGSTSVLLTFPDGRQSIFSLNGSEATAEASEYGRLRKVDLTWVYQSPFNEIFVFDKNGKLVSLRSSNGEIVTISYSNPNVTVTDVFGANLVFSQDGQYQPRSLAVNGLKVSYSYDSLGKLYKVTRVRGGNAEGDTYHYEDARNPKLLTGITNELGTRYATWSYDTESRAVSSEHAGGARRVLIEYVEDGSTILTNELGRKTIYRFQVIQGTKRIVAIEGEPTANCPSSNSTFTYNDRGQVLTKTDAKGFITTYTYNDRGLETTRTEAAGTSQSRITTTTWHATLNLPLTVTENGQVTIYTYDAQGRQVGRINAEL